MKGNERLSVSNSSPLTLQPSVGWVCVCLLALGVWCWNTWKETQSLRSHHRKERGLIMSLMLRAKNVQDINLKTSVPSSPGFRSYLTIFFHNTLSICFSLPGVPEWQCSLLRLLHLLKCYLNPGVVPPVKTQTVSFAETFFHLTHYRVKLNTESCMDS